MDGFRSPNPDRNITFFELATIRSGSFDVDRHTLRRDGFQIRLRLLQIMTQSITLRLPAALSLLCIAAALVVLDAEPARLDLDGGVGYAELFRKHSVHLSYDPIGVQFFPVLFHAEVTGEENLGRVDRPDVKAVHITRPGGLDDTAVDIVRIDILRCNLEDNAQGLQNDIERAYADHDHDEDADEGIEPKDMGVEH